MRLWTILALAVVIGGCTVTDHNPKWEPKAEYPEWAFDRPFYYRPSADLPAAEYIGDGVPVYYCGDRQFFILHPKGHQLTGEPRVAVWSSLDCGMTWQKQGYYGIDQTHFVMRADADGAHFIRFVGPGQGQADSAPAAPHRVYVVDTKRPEVELEVVPASPVASADPNAPASSQSCRTLALQWSVSDEHLDPNSIRLGVSFADFPRNLTWMEMPMPLPSSGCSAVTLPASLAGQGAIRYRVVAADFAGNRGVAVSSPLILPAGDGFGDPNAALCEAVEPAVANRDARPGWPMPGAFLRGGEATVLGWMPEFAGNYHDIRLDFSVNDGRTWETVAVNLTPGKPAAWMVPAVTSRNCRLQLVGLGAGDKPFLLAMTRSFTVDTVAGDTILGPTPIEPPNPE